MISLESLDGSFPAHSNNRVLFRAFPQTRFQSEETRRAQMTCPPAVTENTSMEAVTAPCRLPGEGQVEVKAAGINLKQ